MSRIVGVKVLCVLVLWSGLGVTGVQAQQAGLASGAGRAGEGSGDGPAWEAPPLNRTLRVVEAATGHERTLDELLDRAAGVDAVFLGETHLDETTHRVELAVYEGLLRRTDGKVVLAMEMFSRDVQDVLDRYVAGEMDEEAFLAASHPWGNYRTGYRALIERAREEHLPVVASNVPPSLRRKIAFGGLEVYEALSPEERVWVAPQLFPNSDAYWERFLRVVRGHAAMIASDPERRMTSSQSLWDNTMGFSCAEALAAHPGFLVLHVNGGFHSAYGDGTVDQFQRRRPEATVVTIALQPTDDLPSVGTGPVDQSADYSIYAHDRARGVEDGTHAVTVSRELRYRLHVPPAARDDAPVPLLIWLPEEGARVDDVAAWFELALGEEAAVAVVEMPYPQVEELLHRSGRWFWGDTFREDLGTLGAGITRLAGYVLRHFPVDSRRVVLAGRGAGATVVVSTALHTQRLEADVLAFEPARFSGLHENSLPEKPSVARHVDVMAAASSLGWWNAEAEEYGKAGLDISVTEMDASEEEVEARLRHALTLHPAAAPTCDDRTTLLVLGHDSTLARSWARLYARALAAHGSRAEVLDRASLPLRLAEKKKEQTEVVHLALPGEDPGTPEAPFVPIDVFADGSALPVAPGDFGGTTVLVLPDGIPEGARDAWEAIAESQAIRSANRFASLKIADLGSAAAVLDEVRQGGRASVLVVPAVFCATPEQMRALRAACGSLDRLDVTWLPGLGGSLYQRALE